MRAATELATRQSSETVGGLLERLTSELEKSTETLRGATELATSQSTEVIGGLLARLTKELDKSTYTLGSAADSIADRSSEALGGLVARLTQELEASSGALREAMEKGSESSVSSLASTGDRLRQELSLVLERLSQTGTALDRIVGSASSKLGDIQGDLGDKVQSLQQSLGAIASQVSELDRLSTTTRNDSGAMVERMAAHTAALAEVARELTAKQQTIDLALQHRQTNLENLFASIGSKSRELDELLGSFASSVEESFTKAQARAQDISAALAASTKGTASTVAGQFEMIRENAGRERDRTAQALQSAYDQANAQLAQIMDQAAEKFRQSVAEVKGMANEMQRELDGARHEMRKGVLELPQETQDAANAMRRVVSDQIKALKELAAVVSASGASFDIAEPAPPTAPTLRAESIPSPRAAAPPREDEASRYAPSRPARPPTEPSSSEEAPRALAAPPRPTTPTREDDALRLAPPLAMIEPVRPRAEPVGRPVPDPHLCLDHGAAQSDRVVVEPLGRRVARRAADAAAARSERRRLGAVAPAPHDQRLAGIDLARHRAAGRYGSGERNVGALARRRHDRRLPPPLHGGRSADLRRSASTLPQRNGFPRLGRSLCQGVRAIARQDRPERSRWIAIARRDAVGFGQGLRHARACVGTARLRPAPL